MGAHRGTQWYSEHMEGKEKENEAEGELREDQHAAVIDERRRALVSTLLGGRWGQTRGVLRRAGAGHGSRRS
jgi:hypothetical protein